MSLSQDDFDPLGIVVDWLDACRSGQLDALLDLYDEQATLVCDCERVSLTGRLSITDYWKSKLESKSASAYTLDDMTLTADGVQVDYQSHEGKPVRIRFRFSPSGKILYTSCDLLFPCAA
ncbi:YybH family protein [Bradyrhizobium sp. USDA 10063]